MLIRTLPLAVYTYGEWMTGVGSVTISKLLREFLPEEMLCIWDEGNFHYLYVITVCYAYIIVHHTCTHTCTCTRAHIHKVIFKVVFYAYSVYNRNISHGSAYLFSVVRYCMLSARFLCRSECFGIQPGTVQLIVHASEEG